MAVYYSELMSRLRVGPDIEPETSPEAVPHTREAGYIPVYTLRNVEGRIVYGPPRPVDKLVHEAHLMRLFPGPVTLYEDEHPVFTVS